MSLSDIKAPPREVVMGIAATIMRHIRERQMLCPRVDEVMEFVDFNLECSVKFAGIYQHDPMGRAAEVRITGIDLYGQGKDENNDPTFLLMKVEYDDKGPTVVKYKTKNGLITASISQIAVEGEDTLKKLRYVFATAISSKEWKDSVTDWKPHHF